jgi:2-keto-4-pentenoate hydratase/2-oxohepta-3-ene-1,7-dioic acid hydratase in catechol pathway
LKNPPIRFANPLLFCKTPNALNGPHDPIVLPRTSLQVDWEVELAVIIGREGKRILRKDAFDHIAGFCVMNDVSGRDVQLSESQWFRGKSFDTFAPLGPAIVTPDEIADVHNLRLTTEVNGERMQDGNTRDLIFDVPAIIEFISQDITLVPGDVIATGTPSGVGFFRDPPIVLKEGDAVECSIENIGGIRNEVIKE